MLLELGSLPLYLCLCSPIPWTRSQAQDVGFYDIFLVSLPVPPGWSVGVTSFLFSGFLISCTVDRYTLHHCSILTVQLPSLAVTTLD